MTNLTIMYKTPTMSSKEIAELSGIRHKRILEDVRNMLNSLGIEPAEFSANYKDYKGRNQPIFNLPKRECLILVSGYNIQLRTKIIDRWQELEQVTQVIADNIQINKETQNMNNLVIIQNNTTLTSSEIIAEGVGNQHKNVIELVRKYQDDLEEFGGVAFETRQGKPLPQGGFAMSTEYALLNEQQATLLLTYMQNTSIVREFKKALVKAFYNLVADRKQILELLKIEVQEAKLKASIETETAKLSIIASKKHATVEAYITKTEVAKMKLQAAKEKYAEQSKVLHARTTKLLSQGALVKGNMIASKLDLPTDTITELLKQHGSTIEPKLANWALRQLGYLTKTHEVTDTGHYYGRNIKSSPRSKTTLARWFPSEFPELLKQIESTIDDLVNN